MSDQSVVDELIAQRDRVLFGTWVNHAPENPGEACLAFFHIGQVGESAPVLDALSPMAYRFVREVLRERTGGDFACVDAGRWNDLQSFVYPVLEVLDGAIRLAKESA